MTHGICKMLWLKSLLKELGFNFEGPMKISCNDKAAISIAHNLVEHDLT